MAVNEEVEAYLRSLYAQPEAEFVPFASPEAAVAFQPDMTPQAERPRFGSMLEGQVDPVTGRTLRKPAIQAVREARMAELTPMEAEAEAASLAFGEAMLGAAPMGTQTRAPLPAGMPSAGAGGPMAYMDALAAAQREDELAAGIGRILPSVEQVAQIQSRGAYRPTGLGAVPSAVSRVQQRQAAVADFLRQQREGELLAAQLDAMRALAEQRRREPTQREPVETEAQRKQREAAAEASRALAAKRRQPPTTPRAGAPRASQAPTREERLTGGLRREFEAQQAVKSFGEVQSAFGKVSEAAKGGSPASDLSMLYSYAKLLDPGSVVRESEFQTMAQTGAFGDKVAAAVKKLAIGERLTEAQRADFVKAARQQFAVYGKQFDEAANRYETLAKKAGVAPEDVVFRRKAFVEPKEQLAPAEASTALAPAPAGMVRIKDNKTQRVKEFPEADAMKLVGDPSGRFEVVR